MRGHPRKFTTRTVLTLGLLISVAGGCNETTGPTQTVIVPPPPLIPQVSAGLDAWVPLPVNFVVLSGWASDARHVESYSWKKVSGPDSYSIESPGSLRTTVADLEKGTYEFELTVVYRDPSGDALIAKDRVIIVVYDPRTQGANEFIFKNLRASCDGCDLNFVDRYHFVIENFHDYVPAGTAIKVFLKEVAGSTGWVKVPNTGGEDYVYRINGDRFVLEIDAYYLAKPWHPVDVDVMVTF
jgi:hypothetical protein